MIKNFVPIAVFGLLANEAFALDNDPILSHLCEGWSADNTESMPCGNSPKANQKAFKDLSREYGAALSHHVLAPAETLGANGFQLGFNYALTTINSGETYWKNGIKDGDPPSMLMTTEVDLRKGLPFSFELGARAGWLIESEMFYLGGSLKWALNEAVRAFPVDFAVRASITRAFGAGELDLTLLGFDALISHRFSVGGTWHFTPFAGYSPSIVYAGSGVIDSTPGTLAVGDDASRNFVFDDETIVLHRAVVGFRIVFGIFNFTPEAMLSSDQQTFAANISLDF